ncbi:MAG: ChaN family lipoprotein [Proteobacteria bacterium]|nr:ChaN family lipoprotein [Pseudomonadota bacterium]
MMPRPLLSSLSALACAALAACAGVEPAPAAPGAPWVSEHARAHPLAGRIWQPAEGRFVEAEAVVAALAAARFVLLGEKHDNTDHHRIQAWLLAHLIARGRRLAVAFEMFTSEQEPALAAHLAANPKDAAGIGPALGWAETGWPDWTLYQPIAQAALDGGAPVLAANLPRETIRALAREGVAALGAGRTAALGLDRPLPAELAALLRREIIESHCGQLPDSMIGPMVTVMTARDAHMAEVLVRAAATGDRDAAVLIAGTGHARADHGVPFHLRRFEPEARIVSLGLVEVIEAANQPAAYAERFGVDVIPFDFVWFTPVADPEDPCAKFADQLRRARERHEQETRSTE